MSEKMTAADALVRVLEAEGVEYVFGIPGSHILPFYDALTRSKTIKAILTKHEGGAAYMARMYVRASGKPAVCAATAGPGATNLVTGVADAFCENIPVIVITGQVASGIHGKNADQEASGEYGTPDQAAIFRSVTRHSSLVFRSDKVASKTREAFRLAWSPPYGPVHLSFPSDILAEEVDFLPQAPRSYRVVSWNQVDNAAVAAAAEKLCSARRPALIVGHRALLPDASGEVRRLAEEFEIPVATTVPAKGLLDETHPLSLGVLNLFGHRCADHYLRDADCVIAVGESFTENSCNYYEQNLFAQESLIHIDNDPSQVGRIYPVAAGLIGSIPATLRELHSILQDRDWSAPSCRKQIAEIKDSTEHFAEPEMNSNAAPIKPQRFYKGLSDALPEDAVVQVDIGQNFFWSLRYFQARQGGYSGTWGFKPMGIGAGGACGLSLAFPGRPVVCVCGDGSMQMNGMEIATAANYSLPVTWVVFNDERLNMVHMAQGTCYQERYLASEMVNPDFVAWARSYGALGLRVDKPEELAAALVEACDRPGPAVVDVRIDRDELLPMKPRTVLMAKQMGLDIGDSRTASRVFRKVLDEK